MNDLIAKKYVRALISQLTDSEFEEISATLRRLACMFTLPKLKMILDLPSVGGKEKAEFLYSLSESKNEKIHNFLKLLGDNKRLETLPQIYKEFAYQKAVKDNAFTGLISGNFDLDGDKKKELEAKFSSKFGSNINFDAVKNDYDGIKIELDELGFEVSFSINRLKARMNEYILKAIQ